MKHYDCLFIGTGSGNIILEKALALGLNCAQVEKSSFGGTCLNRGCIPTKVLTTTADRLLEIKEAETLGISVDNLSFDFEKIISRVKHQISQNTALREFYLNEKNLDVYEGTAEFTSDKVIQVRLNNGKLIENISADKIYIGAGGRTKIPPMQGIEKINYLTSESFFTSAMPTSPYKSLIVVGGGAIGCEFAHIFSALDTEVTLVQHNVYLAPKADHEVSEALKRAYEKRGIKVFCNQRTPKIEKIDGKIHLTIENRTTGRKNLIVADEILIAPGIKPNTDWLKLENTSIKMDERGWIQTNEYLETSVENVYAFGDINGLAQLRHKANYEADILAHNLANPPEQWRFASYDNVPAVIFSNPEVSSVGLSEEEAKNRGFDVVIAKNTYADSAKGFALGYDEESKEEAFAKLIIDKKTNHILGFHAIGFFSSTLLQPFVNLLGAGELSNEIRFEAIASDTTKALRKSRQAPKLDPHNAQTVRETMVAHPSLQEVGIWTYYHRDDEN